MTTRADLMLQLYDLNDRLDEARRDGSDATAIIDEREALIRRMRKPVQITISVTFE